MESHAAKRWIGGGALLIAGGIALGAFAAHALKTRLDDYSLAIFEKAVFYQLLHGLGMCLAGTLGCLRVIGEAESVKLSGLFLLGTVIFSGSLYALALTGIKNLGIITPLGGTIFIISWTWLAFLCLRHE